MFELALVIVVTFAFWGTIRNITNMTNHSSAGYCANVVQQSRDVNADVDLDDDVRLMFQLPKASVPVTPE